MYVMLVPEGRRVTILGRGVSERFRLSDHQGTVCIVFFDKNNQRFADLTLREILLQVDNNSDMHLTSIR